MHLSFTTLVDGISNPESLPVAPYAGAVGKALHAAFCRGVSRQELLQLAARSRLREHPTRAIRSHGPREEAGQRAASLPLGTPRPHAKEDLLEQVRVLEYDDPLISSNVADNPHENGELAGVANPIDEQGAAGGIYFRRWTVVDSAPNSKTISATVNWTIKGEAHAVTLTTVKSGDI